MSKNAVITSCERSPVDSAFTLGKQHSCAYLISQYMYYINEKDLVFNRKYRITFVKYINPTLAHVYIRLSFFLHIVVFGLK